MLNIVLFTLIILSFIAGLVALVFPFGKEKVTKVNTTPVLPYAHRIASLEAIRDQARAATAADTHIFVMWFRAFQGYRNDIPASVRYLHMLEWRARVDELYKELPPEISPLWQHLVHHRSGGAFSEGFK